MMPKRDKVQLAYLYFIPKPHKGGTPLRSIVSSMNMPTTGISKFLDKIIRSIFHKAARSIPITDGVDLIQRLEAYTTNECLKSKTYLYTILAQEESLDILIEFLVQHGYQKIQNIPIDIIRKYVDDIFFMSNDSFESIDQMLDEANKFHPNIKLVRQIEAAEPYVAPFGSDHPATLSQFEEEIRQMNFIFLYNVYTSRHIDWRLSTLFSKYLPENFILPVLNTSDDFGYLHHQLLTTSTATAYNKLLRPTDNNELTKGKSLIIHHRHEKRLRNTHRQIRELWNSVFHGTEVINAALMLGTYLIQNLKQELCARMIKHIPSAGSNQEDKTQRQPDKQAANIQSNQTSQ
ncbi:unnamed protein product [Rotaria socialis]|uniref:Uncharacterized protein n=1 Tax=Rotaria socialis TaxID=392032 RepID=A0A821MST3_9BILA|nr:unnamed protein product [Rotaria socialis]